MGALITVFRKEFRENLRDRRTLFSALLFGPLFGPLLFGAMVSRMLDQNALESDQEVRLTLSGSERAPGLTQFLRSSGVKLTLAAFGEDAARAAVRGGGVQIVVIVPAEYPERFAAAVPAPLLLVADSSDSETRKTAARVRAILAGYGSGIAQLRLQARGVNPLIAVPVAINEIDVTTPTGRAVVILGFMTYFVLFAMLMGGLYLAIDSTAGERERGSLESLLSLPVSREALVGGKILATCAYMCLSLAITLGAFVCVFRFVPLERLGMSANLGAGTAVFPHTLVIAEDHSPGAHTSYRLRKYLFFKNKEFADVHAVVEPASPDDQRIESRTHFGARSAGFGGLVLVLRHDSRQLDGAPMAARDDARVRQRPWD